MRLLVAAEGDGLQSNVAKKFGHASFFLEVDTATMSVIPIKTSRHILKNDILQQASRGGITTIITGNLGPHAFGAIAANDMQAALAHDVRVDEAVKRFLEGELKILDAPTLEQAAEEREMLRRQQRENYGGRPSRRGTTGRVAPPTPRGRHHLQQFGGRGH